MGHDFGGIVQSLSRVQFLVTPWTAAHQASLSFTISWSLLKLMSIELVMLSNHLILCHPLLLLPSVFPNIGVFSNELAPHIRWGQSNGASVSWFRSQPLWLDPREDQMSSQHADEQMNGGVLISYCCCNKLPQTQRLKTTWTYHLNGSGAPMCEVGLIQLTLRCQQGCLPSRGSGGESISLPC